MQIYKYQGAGNDFLVVDGRSEGFSIDESQIIALCDRRYGIGADGFMVLRRPDASMSNADPVDFAMDFYNSDGSSGMMCGNGGRCIVAFAHRCGYRSFRFMAPDGLHQGEVLEAEGHTLKVRLQMIDVDKVERLEEGAYFLNTGTVHYVTFRDNVQNVDVFQEGRTIRHDTRFAPVGTNVNFIERSQEGIRIRTFEKGVEDETFACGTGIVASSLASYSDFLLTGAHPEAFSVQNDPSDGKRIHYRIQALRDRLEVDFTPHTEKSGKTVFRNIFLTGPATFVFSTEI